MYNWFVKEPLRLRSLRAIDQRCRNLGIQTEVTNPNEARSCFFTPLLRSGVIEFYGAGRFGLSPTCVLKSGQQLLIINGPNALVNMLDGKTDQNFPGISRAAGHSGYMQLLKRYCVPHYNFSITGLWCKLPQPIAVIKQWPYTYIDDLSGFEFFDQQWKPVQGYNGSGIFRRSVNTYAERYYFSGIDKWYILPNHSDNIDAFNQAVIGDIIQRQDKLDISYHRYTNSLSIKLKQFPIITERLLLLNTLLIGTPKDPLERIYALPIEMLKPIQSYTSNLIHYAQ